MFFLIAIVLLFCPHASATTDLKPEDFYYIHQSRYLTINEQGRIVIQARRHIEGIDQSPLIKENSLLDKSVIINGAFNLVQTHALRNASPLRFKYTFIIPFEHVLQQTVQATTNDIQVIGDIVLPAGSIVIGLKEDILKLKKEGKKLSELYPGISFMGYDPGQTETDLRNLMDQVIKDQCEKNHRAYVSLIEGMSTDCEIAQERMMSTPESQTVHVFALPSRRGQTNQNFYQKYPCEFVKKSVEDSQKKKQKPRNIKILMEGKESFVSEEQLIWQLLKQQPKTDFEGVFKRYEMHLELVTELLSDPQYKQFCVEGTFTPDGQFGPTFIAQIEADYQATIALFPSHHSQTRFSEFIQHQNANIGFIKAFSWSDYQNALEISTKLLECEAVLPENPQMNSLNIVGALLERYPVKCPLNMLMSFYLPFLGSKGGGISTYPMERVETYAQRLLKPVVTENDRRAVAFLDDASRQVSQILAQIPLGIRELLFRELRR